MLEIDGVSVTYGPIRPLTDVSFVAATGSIAAVLGANRAGKTTLLRAISGLVGVKEGTVKLDGDLISGRLPEEIVRRGVAHVPEGRGVITDLTVEENLRLGGLLRKSKSKCAESIERAYEIFPPLRARRRYLAATLSGGERQMLAIGRALASRPTVLLLDEPSLGLAPMVAADLMRVVRDLAQQDDLTVVLVEQNARSALSIADRCVVLALGRVVATGEAAELAGDADLRHLYLGF
ncbi:MAG TPA: ABC transporter ATP-binding protein [Acidimicrobiales bacterium]|nr:ABC transporter ATP-binding protein [Acidimicrobiales bacterium]